MSNMRIEPVTLVGRRVRLEPLAESHAADLFVVGQSLEVWEYLWRGPLTSVEDALAWVQSAAREAGDISRDGTQFPFAIINLATGRAVGSTRYMDISRADWRLEIGWTWLGRDSWRTPLNTECKYLLLSHAFESLKCLRVQLKTDLRNVRSQKAIERLGAVKEGVLRKHMILALRENYQRSTVMYSILDTEWPEVKKKLEEKLQRDNAI
jgi:RimJ/RimL family protein N-acetyltransferase